MALVCKPEELVKAVAERVILCRTALMPFAHQARRIPGIVQRLCNRDFLRRQSEFRFFIASPGRIEFITKACRRSAGKQPRTRRAAIRTSNVTGSKPHTIGCNRIDMRRGDFGIPLATEFAVTKIIGKEDDDVGLPVGCRGYDCRRDRDAK